MRLAPRKICKGFLRNVGKLFPVPSCNCAREVYTALSAVICELSRVSVLGTREDSRTAWNKGPPEIVRYVARHHTTPATKAEHPSFS